MLYVVESPNLQFHPEVFDHFPSPEDLADVYAGGNHPQQSNKIKIKTIRTSSTLDGIQFWQIRFAYSDGVCQNWISLNVYKFDKSWVTCRLNIPNAARNGEHLSNMLEENSGTHWWTVQYGDDPIERKVIERPLLGEHVFDLSRKSADVPKVTVHPLMVLTVTIEANCPDEDLIGHDGNGPYYVTRDEDGIWHSWMPWVERRSPIQIAKDLYGDDAIKGEYNSSGKMLIYILDN